MQDNLFMFRPDKMVDNMRRRCVPTRVAEPFGTHKAFHYGGRRVYTAVAKETSIAIHLHESKYNVYLTCRRVAAIQLHFHLSNHREHRPSLRQLLQG